MNAYKKLCTEFYDIDKPSPPPDEFAFYRRYAENAAGAVLEAMCGSGRFLAPMVEQGIQVHGVDESPHMLAACREKCRLRGVTPTLFEQPLEQLNLTSQYALVFIAAGSFGLITDPLAAQESLRRVHTHMLQGARLLLEFERPGSESETWPWDGKWVERPDGAKILLSWVGRYDAERRTSSSILRYELLRTGVLLETEFEDFDVRFYEIKEMSDLLLSAGFEAIRPLKAHTDAAPEETDTHIVIECFRT